MPRKKEDFQQIRLSRMEIIKEAALTCFAAKGFQSTTMADISKAARISAGLAYNYFSSKDELLKSLFTQGMDRIFEPLKGYTDPMSKENMRHLINHIFQEVERDHRFWKLYFIVMTHPETVNKFSDYLVQAAQRYLTSVAGYFINAGYADPETETRLFVSILDGVCLNYLIDTEHYPIQTIKKRILKQYAE